jgi:hypothetical protein
VASAQAPWTNTIVGRSAAMLVTAPMLTVCPMPRLYPGRRAQPRQANFVGRFKGDPYDGVQLSSTLAGLLDGVRGRDTDGVDRQSVQVYPEVVSVSVATLTSSFRVVPAGEDPAQSVVVPGCGSGRRVGGWPITYPACAWRLPVIQQVWSRDVDAFVP